MESTGQKRRFPPPWTVEQTGPDAFTVRDANGIQLAAIYCRDDLHRQKWANYLEHLTSDEARRIAKGIARLPEFMMHHPGFYSREGGDFRWKRSHPYNVALRDNYVREHWDFINAVCKLNDIPYDPTGQRIERDGVRWTVYEFALQLHAIQFWIRFEGRWMRHNEFMYPDPPNDLPKLKEPRDIYKFGRRPANR
jgi:hypothetical protein